MLSAFERKYHSENLTLRCTGRASWFPCLLFQMSPVSDDGSGGCIRKSNGGQITGGSCILALIQCDPPSVEEEDHVCIPDNYARSGFIKETLFSI